MNIVKSVMEILSLTSKIVPNFTLGVYGWLCNASYLDNGILGWLVDREPPKGLKWPAKSPHYTWGSTRGGAHTQVPLGSD